MTVMRCIGAALLPLTLAGCGFHPLYSPAGTTNAALGAVFVDVIANRNGQLLRQSLQQRLDGDGSVAKKYELSVMYVENFEPIGIQGDNSSDRSRYVGSATWTLKLPGLAGTRVVSGFARAVDGTNVFNGQFFYGDLAGSAIDKRMGDALAEQIAQQLAVYFRTHPEKA